MTTIVDTTIDTIKSMLEEFDEKTKKCDNQDIISFAKVIGEEFAHVNDQLSRSTAIGFGRKLELGDKILKLEHDFGEVNKKFNKCNCLK